MSSTKKTVQLQGVITALITPMRGGQGKEIDRDALTRLVEWQIESGVDGLVAVGTTGESATLTADEQREVIETTVRAARGRVPVIAGAGANATAHAVELSRRAARAGADALLHVTPYYNKPSQEGLFQHFSACAAATDLPVVLYNVPGRTCVDLLPDTVVRLTEVPGVVALKDATGDLRRAAELSRKVGDEMVLLSGDDFTAYPFFGLGGRGVISVVSNVAPVQTAAMWDAYAAAKTERAAELHLELMPLCELLFAETSPVPTKTALAMMGRCTAELRLPLTACSSELRARLEKLLRAQDLM